MNDLDLQPTQTNVSNGTTTPQGEYMCKIILKSMHNCRSLAWRSSVYDHFIIWTFKCDLDLKPTQTNVSNSTTTPQGDHLCKISLKPCTNVEVMARTSSIYDHFII